MAIKFHDWKGLFFVSIFGIEKLVILGAAAEGVGIAPLEAYFVVFNGQYFNVSKRLNCP